MPPKLEPTEEQLETLDFVERIAFSIADKTNRVPFLKRASQVYLEHFGAAWVHHCTKKLVHVYGEENVRDLDPDRGVLLASNHRSFFDLYVVSSVLFRRTNWVKELFFPVRSDYFYDRLDGIAVNAIMSAMAMYPPVMRHPKKRPMNQFTTDVLGEMIARRGTVVGIHPEGTRNKTDDPYTLLPAQPGAGQVIHHARPIVVPVFLLGLGNNIVKQVQSNFDGTGQPITMVFGKPLDFAKHLESPPRLRTYKKIADELREGLTKLGQEEKAIRAREGFPNMAPQVDEVSPLPLRKPKRDVA